MRGQLNGWRVAFVALTIGLAVPTAATAHLERPSYWPDPAPDTSVNPPAGGKVPDARSLSSAVTGEGPGDVRVVCERDRGIARAVAGGRRGPQTRSLVRAIRSIRNARLKGFRVRPSQPVVRYSRERAQEMRRINRSLAGQCEFHSIQEAVNRSGNNDRIVIMPGVYTEPESRRAPTDDPRCNPSLLQQDASGDSTPSYAYQATCPNDQNLIYVQGRALDGDPPAQPRENREGIPESELGECIRCNLQMEGSGTKAIDVKLDAGSDYDGDFPSAKPAKHAKHVVLRVDRGDGFVGRNFLMRGGLEFGFYTEETDGVLLDGTKFYWNVDYGHLSFTSDHHLVKNCDGFGSGDSVVYPGAAPETGSQATDFNPDAPRDNTVITQCDLRGSTLGYSGSMGNGVRITENHIYGNATGIATDTLSSAGHPGFPADSVQIDNNLIYANNLDIYREDSPVEPLVGLPIGTGIVYAGVNDARVHDNWIFDNWRDGAMLFAVPDALTRAGGPEGEVFPGVSCRGAPENGISTSCGNRFFDNKMGQVPPGFTYPATVDQFLTRHGDADAATLPNGNDFWWDEFTSNTANCWFGNSGPDGSAASVTGPGGGGRSPGLPPQTLPGCAGGQDPGSSVGTGDVAKVNYLIDCSEGPDEDTGPLDCDWWTVPPQPGSAAASRRERRFAGASRAFARTAEAQRLRERIDQQVTDGG